MAPSTSGDLVTGAGDQGTPSNLSGALLASRFRGTRARLRGL